MTESHGKNEGELLPAADRAFLRRLAPFPTPQEFLEADPFTGLRNLWGKNQRESEAMFFRAWHVATAELEDLEARFEEELDSPVAPSQLIFLSGHGGSGKSTFLRRFPRGRERFHVRFVDFLHPATKPQASGALKRRLAHELEQASPRDFEDLVGGLESSRSAALGFFEAARLADLIRAKRANLRGRALALINLTFEELLHLFVLECFRSSTPDRINVVILDNLDSIGTDYLSEDVQRSLATVVAYSRNLEELLGARGRGGGVARAFRFVLCLRDVNHAVVDAQLRNTFGGHYRTFDFYPGAGVQRAILERRLNLAKELFSDDATVSGEGWRLHCAKCQAALRVVEIVLRATNNDEYFGNVLSPVFNNNLKEVTTVLVDLVRRFREIGAMGDLGRLERVVGALERRGSLYRYGFRGGLLKILVQNNRDFLTKYRTYTPAGKYPTAYCLHHRVLLVLISNLAECRVVQAGGLRLEAFFCDLWTVVRALCCVYPIRELLQAVGECFQVYRSGWGSLLLVRNKNVVQDPAFDEEVKSLMQCGVETAKRLSSPADLDRVSELVRRRIQDVKLRITPAGFSYVRHILPHFEFYSAISGETEEAVDRWFRQGIFSLFQCGLLRDRSTGGFLFERYIDEVLETAASHVKLMNAFFHEVYEPHLSLTPEGFAFSPYSFKYRGKLSSKRRKGHFHAYSLITAHVGYVEVFRQYCLTLSDTDYSADRTIGSSREANLALAKLLGRYIELLSGVPSTAAEHTSERFRAKVESILASRGEDLTTRVELPRLY